MGDVLIVLGVAAILAGRGSSFLPAWRLLSGGGGGGSSLVSLGRLVRQQQLCASMWSVHACDQQLCVLGCVHVVCTHGWAQMEWDHYSG